MSAVDFTTVLSGIDFTSAALGVVAVGAVRVGVAAVQKGVSLVLSMINGMRLDAPAQVDFADTVFTGEVVQVGSWDDLPVVSYEDEWQDEQQRLRDEGEWLEARR